MIYISVFSGFEFIYNNVASSKFGLVIADVGSFSQENSLSPPISAITQALPRRSKLYQLGTAVEGDGCFEFEMSFFRQQIDPIMAEERNVIANWLTGNQSFKPLRIVQDDMISMYYNCYFKDVKYVSFDGNANGFKATIVCDAPFAWKNPKTIEVANPPLSDGIYKDITEIKLYNISSDHNLTIPQNIEIDLGENNNKIVVTNKSNNNEFFRFDGLLNGEKIRINDLFSIESVTRPNTVIVDNFSGEFLKLINGLNIIKIEGQIKRFKIIFQGGVKIG